jgi:hypothetical protein
MGRLKKPGPLVVPPYTLSIRESKGGLQCKGGVRECTGRLQEPGPPVVPLYTLSVCKCMT